MKYIKADILNDPLFEVWKENNDLFGGDMLITDINDIPDEYVVDIVMCQDCENYDTEWTDDMDERIGYCPINDTFWFPYESCSRGENKNIVTKRSITRCWS